MTLVLLMALTQFPTDVFENDAPFVVMDPKPTMTVSRREVKGSVFSEYRVQLATTYAVTDLCEAIYDWGTLHNDGPGVVVNKVLADGDDVRVVYNQVSKPIVAQRDYALTIVRERLADGSCRIRFRTTNDLAPPKPDGFVRMERVWGEWRLEPQPAGGSRITYTLFSDPAGSVPAFLVHGAQRDSTRDAAVQGVEKTKKWVEAKK